MKFCELRKTSEKIGRQFICLWYLPHGTFNRTTNCNVNIKYLAALLSRIREKQEPWIIVIPGRNNKSKVFSLVRRYGLIDRMAWGMQNGKLTIWLCERRKDASKSKRPG